MNKEDKKIGKYLSVIFYLGIFIIGYALGMNHNIIGVQNECNDFIIDNYFNMTYDDCITRCEMFSGAVIAFHGRTTAYAKNMTLPFNYGG